MSEAYWLAGGHGTSPAEALKQALDEASVRPAWLDALYTLGCTADLPGAARLDWPLESGLDLAALQTAARSLALGEVDLLALVQADGASYHALILAGPRAVGRYNLLPRARLAGWRLAVDDASLLKWLAAAEIDLSGLALQCGSLRLESIKAENLAVTGGVLAQCSALAAALEKRRLTNALMLAQVPSGSRLALLVERL